MEILSCSQKVVRNFGKGSISTMGNTLHRQTDVGSEDF